MLSGAVANVAERAFRFSNCGIGTTLPVHIADTAFVDAIRKPTHADIVRKIREVLKSLFSSRLNGTSARALNLLTLFPDFFGAGC